MTYNINIIFCIQALRDAFIQISYLNLCEDTIFGWYKKDYNLTSGVYSLAVLRNMYRI